MHVCLKHQERVIEKLRDEISMLCEFSGGLNQNPRPSSSAASARVHVSVITVFIIILSTCNTSIDIGGHV
jgi:hypothetical protein